MLAFVPLFSSGLPPGNDMDTEPSVTITCHSEAATRGHQQPCAPKFVCVLHRLFDDHHGVDVSEPSLPAFFSEELMSSGKLKCGMAGLKSKKAGNGCGLVAPLRVFTAVIGFLQFHGAFPNS